MNFASLIFVVLSCMAGAFAADPTPNIHRKLQTSTSLDNGASLSADILSPTEGQAIPADSSCEADVTVEAKASVGEGNADATYIYVIDVSGSINAAEYSQITDFYDGLTDTVFDNPSTKNVGVVQFGTTAAIRTPALLNDKADVKDSYVTRTVGGGTCCKCGLDAAEQLITTNPATVGSAITVIFLGDGACNTGGNPDNDLETQYGATVVSVAALGSVTCPAFSEIPGTCIQTTDPSDLDLAEIVGTKLISGTIAVSGQTSKTKGFNPPGFTVGTKNEEYSFSFGPLGLGSYDVSATTVGDDVLSGNVPKSVTDEAKPLFTVVDNTDPVLNCPSPVINANTDDGACFATVSYSVTATDNCDDVTPELVSGLASGSQFQVGTTTVSYSVADNSGNDASCTFDVIVTDDEAPTAVCKPSTNPAGDTKPDPNAGFLVIEGDDNCGVNQIHVVDSGPSGHAFGPFPTGTKFKYVEAPGAPNKQKEGAGDVDYKLTGNGPATVRVTDSNGNTLTVSCDVEPVAIRHLRRSN